jgi:hypothetical protein
MLKNAVAGAGGGATGEVAQELAPEPYKPLANLAGNVTGGGLTALGTAGAEAAARTARDAGKRFAAPFTEAGRERIAGETLGNRATNRAETLDQLQNLPDEYVAGSEPTAFQATGDMGLGSLEREVATRNPGEFMQRRAEQNAARLESLENVERDGSPADVATTVRQHLQNIDQMTTEALARATDEAAGRLEALGGHGTSEAYGATLRDHAAQARAQAKEQERALWRAVDPEGTLALPVEPLKAAATDIEKAVSSSAKPIAGEEREVLDAIGSYRQVMPFSDVRDLRSRVSAAMREERMAGGETPAYGRLSRLRGAIESTIAGAVEYRAAQDAEAVARGGLNPDQAITARIYSWVHDYRSREGAQVAGSDIGGDAGGRAAGAARVS